MRRLFLALNYCVLVFAVGAWFWASQVAALCGPMCVTELDRNGVIDVTKLIEYDAHLAENPRYTVGMWIQEGERDIAMLYAIILGIIAMLNIIGFHALGRCRKKRGENDYPKSEAVRA